LRLEREADVVPVAEQPVDDGEPDERRAPGDADGARLRAGGLVGPGHALRRGAARPPGAEARAVEQQRGAHLLHLGLQALRAPQHPHVPPSTAAANASNCWPCLGAPASPCRGVNCECLPQRSGGVVGLRVGRA
jgi:hypothetical protein